MDDSELAKKLAVFTLSLLKSHDFCNEGKEDERGSRLCRDNVSYRDDDCKKCFDKSKEAGEDNGL